MHEWLASRAGSEQVFEQLAQLWPEADLYALTREPGLTLDVGGRPVTTTVLDRGWLRGRRGLTLPLMPLAWSRVRGDYDLVVTSHHAMAITNRLVRPGGRHLAYVHSPARYLWSPDIDARGKGAVLAPARALLRRVELRAARRLDGIAANSDEVARRVARFWGREATVVPPPVDTEFFTPAPAGRPDAGGPPFLLGVGRFIGYKNHLRVIELAEAAGMRAVIAGHGPLADVLVERAARATVPVEVRLAPSREELRELYRDAAALVFPTVEDFGMVPVEAQACGTPVLAVAAGGAVQTVDHGVTGFLADSAELADLLQGVPVVTGLDPAACRRNAERFSAAAFRAAIRAWAGTSPTA